MTDPDNALTPLDFDLAGAPAPADPGASPFRVVIDPVMRARLRRALFDLIENHDQQLAAHFADGRLALDSYKEYIEIFASSLRQTMESPEGVAYLMQACGFDVKPGEVNLHPETRWR
jgi:hypothetical protein